MSEVSNVGPVGKGGTTPKSVISGKQEKKVGNAFDAYREFKQKSEAQYKDFQAKTQKEYEEFRNKVMQDYNAFKDGVTSDDNVDDEYAKVLADPDNWKQYEAHEGEKPPIMNKPKTPPVYNSENEAGGEYVQAQIEELPKMDKPKTAPVYNPADENGATVEKNTSPEPKVIDKPQGTTEPEPADTEQKKLVNQVSRQGASGKYSITEGKNGNGFQLNHEMQVRMLGEARKFFSPGFGEIKRDEDGFYNYRGIKSKNYNIVNQRLQSTSIEVSANNAIYNDLLAKKNNGTELTNAEKNFMDYHIKNLALHNLSVDKDGNIIDKSDK